MAVLGQLFLSSIIGIDVGRGVVLIGLAVHKRSVGQTIGEGRLFRRPANGERGYGHHELRQLQRVDDHLGHIDSGAEVTVAQSFLIHQVAERLGEQQRIGSGVDERQEIVVTRCRLAVARPHAGAVEVGTDGQHNGCLFHHRLIEMCRRELCFHLCRAGDNHAVKLQITHRLRACSL